MLPWHKLTKRRALSNVVPVVGTCTIGRCCLNCFAACGFNPPDYACSTLDSSGEPLNCNDYNNLCQNGAAGATATCTGWPGLDACDCEPWFLPAASGWVNCCSTVKTCNQGNDCGEYGDDAQKCEKSGTPTPTICYQDCYSGFSFQINPLGQAAEGYQTATQQATANGPTTNKGCPLTSKYRAGLTTGGAWTCVIENKDNYGTVGSCDPAYGFMTAQKRYGKTPKSPSTAPPTYGFGTLCIKKNTHGSWIRTLLMSGYNRYNYTGYWSGDPALTSESGCRYENEIAFAEYFKGWIDGREFIQGVQMNPSEFNPNDGLTFGCTGVAPLERSLGRSWPLPDNTMQFPLWGASSSEGRGATYGLPSIHDLCWSSIFTGVGGRTGHVCYGPDCLGLVDNEGVGHYLPGTTANQGYHSFSCFNPHALWRTQTLVVPFPTCSVWSLVQAVYDQTWRYTVRQSAFISQTATEAEWVSWLSANYPAINTKLDTLRQRRNNLLAADPSGLTNGVSNVAWYMSQFAQAIEAYRRDANAQGTGFIPYFGNPHGAGDLDHFTPPQVFLWDKTNYKNASAADKWKHLYIPGSANIFFDSGCTNTGEEWRAFKGGFDETCHDMSWGSTSQAQIIQFRVATDSATQVNVVADTQLEITDLGCIDRVLTGSPGSWDNAESLETWCKMCAPKCPYGFDAQDNGYFCDRVEENYYLGMERTRSCTGCSPCF